MREIHLFKPLIDTTAAIKEITNVLDSGFINEGAQVTELTGLVAEILDAKNIILVNSCTSALMMALNLVGASHDDDVVTTSMTCVATNMPIKGVGSNIVWADVDPATGMLTPETIKSSVTPKTKAVIVVLWAGNIPEIDVIYKTCKDLGVKLIIDAAHGFMAGFNGRQIHEYADFTCYSFQAIKHFTTGDGGALVCRDQEDYLRSKKMKWFGLDRDRAKDDKGNWKGQQWDVDIDSVGYKFNMNNVSAAIGLSQISSASSAVNKHRENSKILDELFKGYSYANPVTRVLGESGSSWVYTIVLDKSLAGKRDEILRNLNGKGVKAGVVHVPNHHYTVFEREKRDLPGVDEFFSRQFSLPCGWWLSEDDIRYVFEQFCICVNETARGN